jgi:NAD(P)-dependent dehydrogenase (short-subunit alcohol dehydrogenase family)
MKIIVIGHKGTIGAAVVRALSQRHEIIGVSRQSRPSVDLEDAASIAALFQAVSGVDAVISCAGGAIFKPLGQLSEADFAFSMKSKLMGQVNLIRAALERVKDGGSITVTSGILAQTPMPGSGAISLVNAGLEGFVRAAALEAPRGLRVNVVSPPWVKETLEQLKMDSSHGLPAADVAKAYVAAVEGLQRGETLDPADARWG